MTLDQLAKLGYTCGLETLSEAAVYAELHWDAWPPGAFEELNREIEEAIQYEVSLEMLCVHFLGEDRCRQIDAELHAYSQEYCEPPEQEPFFA